MKRIGAERLARRRFCNPAEGARAIEIDEDRGSDDRQSPPSGLDMGFAGDEAAQGLIYDPCSGQE